MTKPDTSVERLQLLRQCKTLSEFVPMRAKLTPDEIALKQYDRENKAWKPMTYGDLNAHIEIWRKALAALGLKRGERVAVLLNNSIDAILADQAILANGLIPVPLHAIDTPGSSAFILIDSQSSALITNKLDRWQAIEATGVPMPDLHHVILTEENDLAQDAGHPKLFAKDVWLNAGKAVETLPKGPKEDDLAAIVYTSGTTGKPKGVMLTHKAVVADCIASCVHIAPAPHPGSVFLSFLPLSHTFERTCDYIALGMGCTIVFNRSIVLLGDDLKTVKPHVLISVPRIYEKIFARINDQLAKGPAIARFLFNAAVAVGWRDYCAKNKMPVPKSFWSFMDPITRKLLWTKISKKVQGQFGGRLSIAITGGAAMNMKVARVFCALGLAPIQGYGMTECSPIIAGNSLTINQPDTVGVLFKNFELRLAPETHEIQVRGVSVMKGYWNRPLDTEKVLDKDGWLSTGDVGEINEHGLLRIKGRIKEIIVTSTGEKVPPVDLELALETDPLFAQTYVVGENKPFISCVAVLNPDEWKKLAAELKVSAEEASLKLTSVRVALLKRIKAAAADFPHYALPRNVIPTLKPWTIENGFLTPTLKLKRTPLAQFFKKEIEEIYEKVKKA